MSEIQKKGGGEGKGEGVYPFSAERSPPLRGGKSK
jgi:hypothetical protein